MVGALLGLLLMSWTARITGDTLEILDDNATRTLATHTFEGTPVRSLMYRGMIYVATLRRGVYVFRFDGVRLTLVKRLTFHEPVRDIAIEDGRLYVILVRPEQRVYSIASLAGKTEEPPLAYALRFPKPQDKRYTLRGRIVGVKDDKILLDKGRAEGLKVGDRVVIYRSTRGTTYDPFSHRTRSGKIRQKMAVVKVTEVQEHTAVATLGMGDEAAAGDSWQWTTEEVTAGRHYLPLNNVSSVSMELMPSLLFGRGAVYTLAGADYYGDVHLGARVMGGAANEGDKGVGIALVDLMISKDFSLFEIGLRMDMLWATGGVAGSGLALYARLGRLDGSHFAMGLRTEAGFGLPNGVFLDAQYALSRRYRLFWSMDLRGGQFFKTLLGSRVYMRGTGRGGTLIVPVYLGILWHEYGISSKDQDTLYTDDVWSFFIGGGVEYRF